jgi:hypothetical protein
MTWLKDMVPDDFDGDTACGQLCGSAWFFTMRSCEYSKGYGDWCTKLLCIENLHFFCNKKELPYDHPELHWANMISITFYSQKNDKWARCGSHSTPDTRPRALPSPSLGSNCQTDSLLSGYRHPYICQHLHAQRKTQGRDLQDDPEPSSGRGPSCRRG